MEMAINIDWASRIGSGSGLVQLLPLPGRRTVNTEPLPGSLATVTSPPITTRSASGTCGIAALLCGSIDRIASAAPARDSAAAYRIGEDQVSVRPAPIR
jgi:hypothetical protein